MQRIREEAAEKKKEATNNGTSPKKTCRDCIPSLPACMTAAGGFLAEDSSSRKETVDMAEAQQVDLKRMLRHNYSELLYAIVATRGALLQAVPSLTLLSIFASTLSRTPMLVYSKRLAGNLPELIISKPFIEARLMEQELIDEQEWIRRSNLTEDQNCVQNPQTKMFKGILVRIDSKIRESIEEANKESRKRMREILNMPTRDVDEWIVAINGTIIYVTESRSISFCVNLYKFILTIGMLWTDPDKLIWWMASAVVVILPFSILTALGAVVVIGKALYITDSDLEHALSCVGLTGVFRWVLKYTGSTKSLESDIPALADSDNGKNSPDEDPDEVELAKQMQDWILGDENRDSLNTKAGLDNMEASDKEDHFFYDVYDAKDEIIQSWTDVPGEFASVHPKEANDIQQGSVTSGARRDDFYNLIASPILPSKKTSLLQYNTERRAAAAGEGDNTPNPLRDFSSKRSSDSAVPKEIPAERLSVLQLMKGARPASLPSSPSMFAKRSRPLPGSRGTSLMSASPGESQLASETDNSDNV
jgi:hypothetical protein